MLPIDLYDDAPAQTSAGGTGRQSQCRRQGQIQLRWTAHEKNKTDLSQRGCTSVVVSLAAQLKASMSRKLPVICRFDRVFWLRIFFYQDDVRIDRQTRNVSAHAPCKNQGLAENIAPVSVRKIPLRQKKTKRLKQKKQVPCVCVRVHPGQPIALMATEPKPAKPFACSQCFDSFPTKFGLIAHMRKHSKPNQKRRRDPADGLMGQEEKDGAEDTDNFTCRGCHKPYKYYSSYLTHLTKCRKYDGWKKSKEQQEQQQRVAQLGGAASGSVAHDDLVLGETPIPFGSNQAQRITKSDGAAITSSSPTPPDSPALLSKRVLPESPMLQQQNQEEEAQDADALPDNLEPRPPSGIPGHHTDELPDLEAHPAPAPLQDLPHKPVASNQQSPAFSTTVSPDLGGNELGAASTRILPSHQSTPHAGALKTKRILPGSSGKLPESSASLPGSSAAKLPGSLAKLPGSSAKLPGSSAQVAPHAKRELPASDSADEDSRAASVPASDDAVDPRVPSAPALRPTHDNLDLMQKDRLSHAPEPLQRDSPEKNERALGSAPRDAPRIDASIASAGKAALAPRPHRHQRDDQSKSAKHAQQPTWPGQVVQPLDGLESALQPSNTPPRAPLMRSTLLPEDAMKPRMASEMPRQDNERGRSHEPPREPYAGREAWTPDRKQRVPSPGMFNSLDARRRLPALDSELSKQHNPAFDALPLRDRHRSSAPLADRAYVKIVDYFSRLFDENCTMRARYAAEFIHFNIAADTKNTNTLPLDAIPNKVAAYLKANNLMV